MNLFVVGWSPRGTADTGRAAGALRELLAAAGFLDPGGVETWSAPSGTVAAAWAQHDPELTGGVRYAHAERGRLALFAGRPFRWVGEDRADGRGPLDPRHYLAPAADWVDAMDGRWLAARCDDEARELEVAADAMGAYALFRARDGDGTEWFSGNPELLALVTGERDWDVEVLASLLGGGFSLTGHPWWTAVRRVPRGAVVRLRRGEPEAVRERLAAQEVARLPGAGFDAARAARTLVAGLKALADWPGRPSLVPITAGRDSRLVFAAALHADFEWEAVTAGEPGMEDVDRGRAVCQAAGVAHRIPAFAPHGSVLERPRRLAQVVALTTAGSASAADGAGFPLGPGEGPLALWHSGHGSEVGRALYGLARGLDRDGLVERLYSRYTTRRPGRAELIGGEGPALVRAWLARFVDEQLGLGANPEDVPDLFYFHGRLARWAGPTHACVEWIRDTTSPTWSPRLLPDELGLPARERALQLFHMRVLEQLAPQLVDVPFEGNRPWPARQSAARRRAARAAAAGRRALAELRRRARPSTRRGPAPGSAPGPVPPESFAPTLAAVREAALSDAGHPAWQVLDRTRVETLLRGDPSALDPMGRAYVWRLATVFLRAGGD